MRTTIELTKAQHRSLVELAGHRGMRGFSALVQEAVDAYLANLSGPQLDAALALGGVLDQSQTDEMRRVIDDSRSSWRV